MKSEPVTKKKQRVVQASDAELIAKKERAAEEKAAILAQLNSLPIKFGSGRILDAKAAAAYWGVSLPHWRRLYRAGKVPRPIKIGDRKLGWPIGPLAEGLAQRAEAAG